MAEKALKKMSEMNDEATLTQLSSAYVTLAKGVKIQDAEDIFQELIDKFGESVALLNGKALCLIRTSKFTEAEKILIAALGKRNQDPETLINLIVCAQHLKKSKELVQRYISQLKSVSPNHPWVKDFVEMENGFTKSASKYGVKA